MDQEVKARWVEALRSGKYTQGREYLRDGSDNFCCLGVLCDLVKPSAWSPPWEGDEDDMPDVAFGFDGERDAQLPSWGVFGWDDDLTVTISGTTAYLHLHNDHGHTFADIADAIEAQL